MRDNKERLVVFLEPKLLEALRKVSDEFDMPLSALGRIGVLSVLENADDKETFWQYISHRSIHAPS